MAWVPVCVHKFETMLKKLLVFKPLVGHKTCAGVFCWCMAPCAVQGGVSCSVWRVGIVNKKCCECPAESGYVGRKKQYNSELTIRTKSGDTSDPPPNPATVTTGNPSKPLFATVTGCGTQEMQESLMYSPCLCQMDLYARTLLAVDVNSIYLWVAQVICNFPQQRCGYQPSFLP